MSILTNKPATIIKGQSYTLNLNKVDLKSNSAITDSYFQDESNWLAVSIEYSNAQGQIKRVVFTNPSDANPEGTFSSSTKARGDFLVVSITIFDMDDSSFKIPRSSLIASELDLTYATASVVAFNSAAFLAEDVDSGLPDRFRFDVGQAGVTKTLEISEDGTTYEALLSGGSAIFNSISNRFGAPYVIGTTYYFRLSIAGVYSAPAVLVWGTPVSTALATINFAGREAIDGSIEDLSGTANVTISGGRAYADANVGNGSYWQYQNNNILTGVSIPLNTVFKLVFKNVVIQTMPTNDFGICLYGSNGSCDLSSGVAVVGSDLEVTFIRTDMAGTTPGGIYFWSGNDSQFNFASIEIRNS